MTMMPLIIAQYTDLIACIHGGAPLTIHSSTEVNLDLEKEKFGLEVVVVMFGPFSA